jgi:NAD(P)-dependent dehydrogenase (short-subunit alcohol dehydrogenase family)
LTNCFNADKLKGGASGSGAAIATRFVQEGACVVIGDINLPGAKEIAAKTEAGDRIATVEMDVTVAGDWKAAVDEAIKRWNRLDIVVNNAGITYQAKVS